MALNQEQESIAQAIANMGNSAMASHHSANYRAVAQRYNTQKVDELNTRIQSLRTEIQANVTNSANQNASVLRAEMSKLNVDLSMKHATLINECNMVKNRCEELSGDVKFVRHELKSIGDKFTTLNHYATNKNKEIILVIESLQKEIQALKTHPPKTSYTLPALIIFLLTIAIGFGSWANQSTNLMIEY